MVTIRKVTIQSSQTQYNTETSQKAFFDWKSLIQRIDANNTYRTKFMTVDSYIGSLKIPSF